WRIRVRLFGELHQRGWLRPDSHRGGAGGKNTVLRSFNGKVLRSETEPAQGLLSAARPNHAICAHNRRDHRQAPAFADGERAMAVIKPDEITGRGAAEG